MFCFTPKGRLIALPRGANPIDFAYAVHTDVGNTCVGAKINGRPMPLTTELRNGDEVEIICSKAQLPPSAWQSLAVTGKARSAIRRATRDAVRAQYGKLGREILVRAFQRREKTFSEESLAAALGRLSQKTAEDVMAAVGRGELASADVVRAVFPEEKSQEPLKRRRKVKRTDEGWFGLGKVMGLKFRWPGSSGKQREHGPAGIPIRGLRGDLPVSFADGGAVPGDRIVGILTPGQGITIYPIHAEALKAFDEEPERWIDVTWDIDEDNPQRFPAKLAVTVHERAGQPRPGRLGNRRGRRQYRQHQDDQPRARLYRDPDRPRGLGSQASERHHRRARGPRTWCPARRGLAPSGWCRQGILPKYARARSPERSLKQQSGSASNKRHLRLAFGSTFARFEVVMLFRRRETESFLERMRVHLWPRRSWTRSSRYVVYRLRRLSDTPHAVALGFAIGVFTAVTPFLGTHMVVAALLAWIIGGSVVAALLGTFVGNPLTYPLFWYSTYEVGNLMLRRREARRSPSISPAASFNPRSTSSGRS